MKKTMVICAFPASGKTYFRNNSGNLLVFDSDSSNFSWLKDADGNNTRERNPKFPENYVEYIRRNIGVADYILVSSHKTVRDALREAGIEYLLVYPDRELIGEWVKRCLQRENNGFSVNVLIDNWDSWIDQCEDEAAAGVPYVKLQSGKYLSDIIEQGG